MSDITVWGRRTSNNISLTSYSQITGRYFTPEMPWDGSVEGSYTVWGSEDEAKLAVIAEAINLMQQMPNYPAYEYTYVVERNTDGTYSLVGPYTANSAANSGPVTIPQNAVAFVHNHPLQGPAANTYPGTSVTHYEASKAPSAAWQNPQNLPADWENYDAVMATRGGAPLAMVIVGPDNYGRVYEQSTSRAPGYVSFNGI